MIRSAEQEMFVCLRTRERKQQAYQVMGGD